MRNNFFRRFIYFLRDLRSADMYRALHRYCAGDVLDVGGSDFFITAKKRKIPFRSWTAVEPDPEEFHNLRKNVVDPQFYTLIEDGCNMKSIPPERYDTVINIQVLEHVYSPQSMVSECARVMKKGGVGIFLIPQTGSIHMIPNFYCNFSRYWIEKTMKENNLDIINLEPLGGVWTTIASRMFLALFQMARSKNYTDLRIKRNLIFYLLLPLQIIYVFLNVPILMFLSLGDIQEEPNNHLVIVKKRT